MTTSTASITLSDEEKRLLDRAPQMPVRHRGRQFTHLDPKEVEVKEKKPRYVQMVAAIIVIVFGVFLALGLPFLGAGGMTNIDPLILFGVVPGGLILTALGGLCCLKSISKSSKDIQKKDKKTLEKEKKHQKLSVEKAKKKQVSDRLGLID